MTGPRGDDLWDGRYRLVRRLGAGGMASVWLARDERLGREVALKLLSDVLAGDQEYIKRFEREARVAAGLNHPNLVTLFDFAVADERPYLLMELVTGGTVAQRAAAGGLTAADVERLAGELLAALEHIHEAGVVHRDLKPANVLVDDRERFRLTDFGIAQPGDATSLTQTGKLIGTMKYMAPEVRAGRRATVRSDLYSLGVLLRECGAESVPSLAPLLDALAHDDPAERPASARAAAALLRVATVPTTRVLVRSHRRRLPLVILAGALVTAVVVALALAAGGGDDGDGPVPPIRDERAPADERQPASPAPEPRPEPQAQPEPQPGPSVPTCAELEEEKRAIEQEKKAAEKAAGDDKEAKEAIKADAEARNEAIEEQKEDCVE